MPKGVKRARVSVHTITLQDKICEIQRELETIAHSDAQMGVYDIEHLENARQLLRELAAEVAR